MEAARDKLNNIVQGFTISNLPEERVVIVISLVLIVLALISYITLLTIPANYGRYYSQSPGMGLLAWVMGFDNPLPAWLCWVIMESPNILVVIYLKYWVYPGEQMTFANIALLSMFLIHYVYRSYVYPFLGKQKPFKFLVFFCAVLFCSLNGYAQGTSLIRLYRYGEDWMFQPKFIIGVSVWAFGFLTNIYSDHLLRNLRKPGETGYKIPKGFLFEYVSCANYFGELVEWLGYTIACWSLPAFSFFIFTFGNLVPRAISHHKYYLQKMEDYPKDRKAVIPFIL